jgi:hypothetical protein
MDQFAPERSGPLLPELWEQLAACMFVAGSSFLAASLRPGRTVLSEFLSDATRSIAVGALLTFFGFQVAYFSDRISLVAAASAPWTKLFPGMILAWPVLSLLVFGFTAGNSQIQPPSSASSGSE